MNKNCKNCAAIFQITSADKAFYVKMNVLEPTFCPSCRLQRRLSWRNERNLYKRKCAATGKDIISNYSVDKPFPVIDKDYWWTDAHDPLKYGINFDFSKTFIENFNILQSKVPRFSVQQQEPMINSEYCNCASNCKNSYLLFDSDFCEDSYYSNVLKNSKDCCDCSFTSHSQLCYESVHCKNCYNLRFSQNCTNCSDSIYLDSCIGCSNCAFCTNLHSAKYYFLNKKYSKEEYEKKIADLGVLSYSKLNEYNQKFRNLLLKHPRRFMYGTQNENVTGNHIYHTRDAHNCFNLEECWDMAYCDLIYRGKDCWDLSSFGENVELAYESVSTGLNVQRCKFTFNAVIGSSDIEYCSMAYSCKNCFGCVGIKKNNYCIFNKQYSEEEYKNLREKIIDHMKKTGEWGEFMPISASPFGYNETVAQDYFPLTKEQAIKKGYNWKDPDKKEYQKTNFVPPDSIESVDKSICDQLLSCSNCGKNYKITPHELQFYKKVLVPIPLKCPDCRHFARMNIKESRKLFARTCSKCGKEIQSIYSKDQPEIVYCEECYLGELR